MDLSPGFAFWAPNFRNDKLHAYITITHPVEAEGTEYHQKIICFSITDYRHWHDQACILEAGEHPCITKKSVVNYADPISATANQLETLLTLPDDNPNRLVMIAPPFDAALVKHIKEAARISQSIPEELLAFLR